MRQNLPIRQPDFFIKFLSTIADKALCNPRFVLSDPNGSLLIRKVMENQREEIPCLRGRHQGFYLSRLAFFYHFIGA